MMWVYVGFVIGGLVAAKKYGLGIVSGVGALVFGFILIAELNSGVRIEMLDRNWWIGMLFFTLPLVYLWGDN